MSVEPKLIETWLDIAPQYINFALRFPRSPKKALERYSGTGAVASDLTSFAVAGVVISYLFVLVFAPGVTGSTPKTVVEVSGKVGSTLSRLLATDPKIAPALALLAVVTGTVFVHLFARIATLIGSTGRMRAFLGGSVEDSVNAALGFAAVYIPYFVLLSLCGVHLAATHPSHSFALVMVTSFLASLAVLVYYPLSLAATHPNTKPFDAFWAFVVGAGLLSFLLGVIS